MPTAIVTGAPERVPDITIALKAAGFDILAVGSPSAGEIPDLEPGSVDCYVQLPADRRRADGSPLRSTAALIGQEVLDRCDAATRLLPLLAPGASVMLVIEGPAPGCEETGLGETGLGETGLGETGRGDPGQRAVARMVSLLAGAIPPDSGPAGVRTTVVDDSCAPQQIAEMAGSRPPEPYPWWVYAEVDLDLDYADWRTSILALASPRES